MKKVPTYHFQDDSFDKLSSLTDLFLENGLKLFEKEFSSIDSFVKQANSDKSERTDHTMRQSEKEKYLLEMLSYKIYDKLNREAFNKTKNTLIIMPDCLSLHEYECLKTDDDYGNICESCHAECQASEIAELAEKYNCRVMFSKRSLSEQLKYHAKELGDTSVIGIACIMMLSSGMRVAHENNIPSRGVLLNYTGCDHWNDEPFASEFSLHSLKQILMEKYGD